MGRVVSDFKTCKHCLKTYKFAWVNQGDSWKLCKALEDEQGKLIRRSVTRTSKSGMSYQTTEPIPEEPLRLHVCGSIDGFSPREDLTFKDLTFNPDDFHPFGSDQDKRLQTYIPEAEPKFQEPNPKQDSREEKQERHENNYSNMTRKDQTQETQLATILARAIEPHIKAKLNSEEIKSLIDREVTAQVSAIRDQVVKHETVLVIEREKEGGEVEKSEVPDAHPLLPTLIKVVQTRKPDGQRLNTYLYGLPGSSKTTSARLVSQILNLPFYYISLNPQTADSRINGYKDVEGRYQETPFYLAYTAGGVFCIDEIDNASDNLLTSLNSAIDNGHAAFPCGIKERHKDFILIATANTAGRGGDLNHAGRRPLDAATLERFVFMHWPYDEALEESLTLKANPKAEAWLLWIRLVREYAQREYPRLVVSPRASINGATLIKSSAFPSLRALADSILFKGLDKESTEKILRACPLPKTSEVV